jgi:hypothetical protein
MKRNRVSFAAILCAIGIACARADEPAKPPTEPPPSFRTGLLTEQSIDRSRKDFNQCLEAAAEVQHTEEAYASGKGSIAELLHAERKLTAAQIHYLTTTSNARGNPTTREYLTRRGEVSSLERGLASIAVLTREASDADQPQAREEAKRYQEAIKEARRELLRAEYAWKTASRADQLRYLDRKNDPR